MDDNRCNVGIIADDLTTCEYDKVQISSAVASAGVVGLPVCYRIYFKSLFSGTWRGSENIECREDYVTGSAGSE